MMSKVSSFLGISSNTFRAPIHYPELLSFFYNGFHHQRSRLRFPSSHHNLPSSQCHGLTISALISSKPGNQFLPQTHHQCSRSETIHSIPKEIDIELLPFLRIYKDGSVERLMGSPYVPPTLNDPDLGVSSKDITISQNPLISARIFLPKLNEPHKKIPILVYYHGGAFCVESAFSFDHHRFLNSLVSQAEVVAVSVEYRMAPEHSLPIAYEDSWAALNWVALHFADNGINEEPWLINHGDPNRLFVGGDSAGANIAHNVAMRVGKEGLRNDVNLLGVFLTHPLFWGSKPIEGDPCEEPEKDLACLVWNMAYPSAPGGIDNPMINPVAPEAPSLAGLGCSRLLVCVSENDELRHRGVGYYEAVKRSGFEGETELVEVEGEDHAFHILKFESRKAKELTKKLADFLLSAVGLSKTTSSVIVMSAGSRHILTPDTGVSSKDIIISDNPKISARFFLPQKLTDQNVQNQKLPVFVYFHGGGFCFESTFSSDHHHFLNRLVSKAQVVAISVEYRLAPEVAIPTCYQDCWDALQSVASHAGNEDVISSATKEPWLLNYGDFGKFYIGGDSAGGNIVHNVAMKAGAGSSSVKLVGAFLSHTYFMSSKPLESEPKGEEFKNYVPYVVWGYFNPSTPGGIDSPMVNPAGPGAPSLAELGCSKLVVCVSSKDQLRDRGVWYYDLVKGSGFKGKVELFEVEGEVHAFHILSEAETPNVKKMINKLASFLV